MAEQAVVDLLVLGRCQLDVVLWADLGQLKRLAAGHVLKLVKEAGTLRRERLGALRGGDSGSRQSGSTQRTGVSATRCPVTGPAAPASCPDSAQRR